MKRYLPMLLLLSCLGREDPDHSLLVCGEDLSYGECLLVFSAAEEWNQTCGTHLSILRSEQEDQGRGAAPIDFDIRISHSAVTHLRNSYVKSIEVRQPGEFSRPVILHELGHVLGLPHLDQGIMQPTPPDVPITVYECYQLSHQ